MNAMISTSELKKYSMWNKVREIKTEGLNISQISRTLGIYRGTVSRYLKMSEEDFLKSQCFHRTYHLKLSKYEDFVKDRLENFPFLSASQIHDHLKEHHSDFPEVNPKTVFNYVGHIRKKFNIPKSNEKEYRPFEKLPETEYGEYAQVDFGERYMSRENGGHIKVYFFAIVLSRSRQKYIYFSLNPFTTAQTIYAHELAFSYYEGKPKKIIYDQDKVLLKSENLGDLLLTQGFRRFVSTENFETVFCKKSDPQSKGKIENVVKYVKYNFLSGRNFKDIDTLNNEALMWLSRTGNGTEHATTKLIPNDVFMQEKSFLTPYSGIPTLPQINMRSYYVRKDNTINYRSNYYTLPLGTYKGINTQVFINIEDNDLHIFDKESGKTIAVHTISSERGKTIRSSSHARDNTASLKELEQSVIDKLGESEELIEYLNYFVKHKSRYYRDNLTVIKRESDLYPQDIIHKSIIFSIEKGIYNANVLFDIAKTLYKQPDGSDTSDININLSQDNIISEMIPEKTDIKVFNSYFQ